MPFNTPLPDQGTNPWYTPFKTAWDALVVFVNGLESTLAGKASAEDLTDFEVAAGAELAALSGEVGTKATQTSVDALSAAQVTMAGNLDSTFTLATEAQADAGAALAGLETKVSTSSVAGLDSVGWGRVIYIANGAPDPTGLPDYTEVIRLPA